MNRNQQSLEHGHREFYKIPENLKPSKRSEVSVSNGEQLSDYIYNNIIGDEVRIQGPYGLRKVVYCDYVASGKPLKFIEDYIQTQVLPTYGNTHTTTSITSLQTTLFRHEAREIIRNTCNAGEYDAVIFCGSGVTGSVHKLIHGLGLTEAPTVIVGPFEHHSNLLPWREIGSHIVRIKLDGDGCLDCEDLKDNLKRLKSEPGLKICTFSACSNITGVLTDTVKVTVLCHRYGALVFWDYATAGPYVPIDMNPVVSSVDDQSLAEKDAIFLSTHKFIGGTQTPGILIGKKKLFKNPVPSGSGGGSVFYVTRASHRYLRDIESREEGGTPAIVECVRAGLVFQLKEAVGAAYIEERELELASLIFKQLAGCPNLVILGPDETTPRLPVISFHVYNPETGYFLHHNFVCALLNDLFGVQARGGCACAGPYAQDVLGLSEENALRFEQILLEDSRLDRTHLRRQGEHSDKEVFRPGFSRFNIPYFMPHQVVSFVLDAVRFVATKGWKLLPYYMFNPETGEWHHKEHQVFHDRKWLGSISYESGRLKFATPKSPCAYSYQHLLPGVQPKSFSDVLSYADFVVDVLPKIRQNLSDQALVFDTGEARTLRWFALPSEVNNHLHDNRSTNRSFRSLPFIPDNLFPVAKKLTDMCKINVDAPVDGAGASDDPQTPIGSSPTREPKLTDFPDGTGDADSASPVKFHNPPKHLFKMMLDAITEFEMITHGDRVLVCLSGGKDSLSMLHALRQYQIVAKSKVNLVFELGAVTVDPKASSYDPSSLIDYLKALGVPYFYETQHIMNQAQQLPRCASICSFCSRMKRGIIYSCARREGYNVVAMGHHLDDLVESFFMSVFHNGFLRTMKSNYLVQERDLRVIRPMVYVRERETRDFAKFANLPVIAENCPACFEAPKERHRVKQLLATQELLFPRLFKTVQRAIHPLMAKDRTGLESRQYKDLPDGVKATVASNASCPTTEERLNGDPSNLALNDHEKITDVDFTEIAPIETERSSVAFVDTTT